MILFNTDLDNTLIYSYKHDIGEDKVCVEIYNGREISFMTKKSHELLNSIKDKILIVPTTTRTIEQFSRIDLGTGTLKYALVCNGGVLLEDGVENEVWYQESCRLVSDCMEELKKAEVLLENDKNRVFEIRDIKELFLFTKSREPYRSVESLKAELNPELVDVFCNGTKVYVVPKKLSKGMAIRRFRQWVGADMIIAAGDSEFDISMLEEADIAFAAEALIEKFPDRKNFIFEEKDIIFSDTILRYLKRR